MEDDSFAMLAKPAPKKKSPENASGEEDTVSDTDRPTKIDPSEITQAAQQNAPPETPNKDGPDAEYKSYPPTPGEKQSAHFEIASERDQDGEVDLEQRPAELVSEVDKTDEDGAGPKTKKCRSEYTHSRGRSQDKEEESEEEGPDGKMAEPPTRKNQLSPPKKETMPSCIIIALRMPSREHSSIRQ